MIPLLPPDPIFITERCNLECLYETIHRIQFAEYNLKKHIVKINCICTECEKRAIAKEDTTMNYIVLTFSVCDWSELVEAYYGYVYDKN